MHEMQLNAVKGMLVQNPSWTINDILNTDAQYMYDLMFAKVDEQPKPQEAMSLRDFVKSL